ncbi:MAG: beta-L-arabinofuranosidase domain-containing protein, partial [Sphingomonas sp.]
CRLSFIPPEGDSEESVVAGNTQAIRRRSFLRSASMLPLVWSAVPRLALAAGVTPAKRVPPAAPVRPPRQNCAPLASQPLLPLPVGSIKPAGWLRRQLEIQALGLGGRLDETWADVGPNSGWLGGDGESWERGPDFVDGLLPLAWALDDEGLKAKAQRFIDWTLDHPWSDGMIGPRSNDDWWPRMVMAKVLIQYHELTEDPRVIPMLSAYFDHQLAALPGRPLKDWGKFRWHDEVVAVLWLYNRTGDAKLLDLARLLHAQGWDWQREFADFPFRHKVTLADLDMTKQADGNLTNGLGDRALSAHGVNNAMGIKAAPVWSLVSGKAADREAVHHQLAELDRYHGMPTGMFAADEHLAGRSPSQGVELCAVVETLYSLELAAAITGDARIGDRIERIAYNALPATFTDDMWAHQYDQQPNQIKCSLAPGPWTTNGPEANLFGLEPHFGCCTANFHQGWPKLNDSLWMGTADGGLAALVYAPCTVRTMVADVPVRLAVTTDYPFRDTVAVDVAPARPARFPLKLRIPAWARSMTVTVNGTPATGSRDEGFLTLLRTWKAGDAVAIRFVFEVEREPGYNDAVSVVRGPLVFALPVAESWQKWRPRGLTADWEVYPAAAWNYALADAPLGHAEHPVSAVPFSRRTPPATVTATVVRAPDWVEAHGGFADPPPQSPVAIANPARETVTLIPYGAAKLRVTAMPVAQT